MHNEAKPKAKPKAKPFNFDRLQCIPPISDAIEMVYY